MVFLVFVLIIYVDETASGISILKPIQVEEVFS